MPHLVVALQAVVVAVVGLRRIVQEREGNGDGIVPGREHQLLPRHGRIIALPRYSHAGYPHGRPYVVDLHRKGIHLHESAVSSKIEQVSVIAEAIVFQLVTINVMSHVANRLIPGGVIQHHNLVKQAQPDPALRVRRNRPHRPGKHRVVLEAAEFPGRGVQPAKAHVRTHPYRTRGIHMDGIYAVAADAFGIILAERILHDLSGSIVIGEQTVVDGTEPYPSVGPAVKIGYVGIVRRHHSPQPHGLTTIGGNGSGAGIGRRKDAQPVAYVHHYFPVGSLDHVVDIIQAYVGKVGRNGDKAVPDPVVISDSVVGPHPDGTAGADQYPLYDVMGQAAAAKTVTLFTVHPGTVNPDSPVGPDPEVPAGNESQVVYHHLPHHLFFGCHYPEEIQALAVLVHLGDTVAGTKPYHPKAVLKRAPYRLAGD